MEEKQSSALSRRQFIRQAACAAVGTAALTATIRDLRFMNAAVAQSNIPDYKALVCVFLAGGNDSNNLIVPTIPSEYNNYATIRTPVLALPQASLLNLGYIDSTHDYTPLNNDGHTYGLHPSCPELRTLFGESKLAILFNTGTLVYPITRAQYFSGVVKKPPQLFSHADQVTQWQTSIPDAPPVTGWGGRCADLLYAVQPGARISLSVSLAGANTLEVGNIVSQYSVSTSGAIALSLPSTGYSARQQALTNILGLPYTNLQSQAYAGVAEHSINTGQILNAAIDPYADLLDKRSDGSTGTWIWNNELTGIYTGISGGFPRTTLGNQLKMVARLIAANTTLAMKRQVFFCSVGGYDLHTNQTRSLGGGAFDSTLGSHATLLTEVSRCLLAFQRAMEQLGLSNQVTAFTSSDFSRTFPSNGQGSDHGWGSHHLILGGAVLGRRTYGVFPTLTLNGPDDTGTGRWIPTTAVDQYFATLATWFGVDNSNLATVFPNLARFATSNLGFI